MSKRKLEEFQDPDYKQFNDLDIKKSKLTASPQKEFSTTERIEKIKSIINREFQNELLQKEQEINKIELRIMQAKCLLHRVRYAIVANFYSKKNLLIDNESDSNVITSIINNENGDDKDKPKIIHPSIKKLIGKAPINYDELLRYRQPPTRKAAQTAKKTISARFKKKKDPTFNITESTHDHQTNETHTADDANVKIPRYIEPIKQDIEITSLNSSRGRNQVRQIIIVGNTSKYIGHEKSVDGVTHKWLVYIRTKTEAPLEKFVRKVRFFLHPSYKPNDVVEVTSPPFQLSRRGWGEFPIRIQLYFDENTQQKPLQIIHNLVLDRKMSGLQTMGAETVVEIWINSFTDCRGSKIKDSNEHFNNNNATNLNYSDLQPLNIYERTNDQNNTESEIDEEKNKNKNDKIFVKQEEDLHITDIFENGWESETEYEQEFSEIHEAEESFVQNNETTKYENDIQNPVILDEPIEIISTSKSKRDMISTIKRNGQIYIVDPKPKPKNKSLLKSKNQISLLKPNLSLLKPIVQNKIQQTKSNLQTQFLITDHDYAGLSCEFPPPIIFESTATKQRSLIKSSIKTYNTMMEKPLKNISREKSIFPNNNSNSKQKLNIIKKENLDYYKILENVFLKTNFITIRTGVEFLLKKIPLTTLLNKENLYRMSFPFTSDTKEIFFQLTKIKQKSFEWLRAKMINRMIKKKFVDDDIQKTLWTTKEILIFSRKHGYTPIDISLKKGIQTDNNLVDFIKNKIKQEKFNSHLNILSLNHSLNNWLQENYKSIINQEEIIDLEDDDVISDNKRVIKSKLNENTVEKSKTMKLYLPLNELHEEYGIFVTDICDQIGIRCSSEEIIENVYFPTVQMLLINIMKLFVEDILRRSYSHTRTKSSDIQPRDIIKAISSRVEYDILTNKNLGVSKIKDNDDRDKT